MIISGMKLILSCFNFSLFFSFTGMPVGHNLYANDLIEVLKKKHASGTYKSLVSH